MGLGMKITGRIFCVAAGVLFSLMGAAVVVLYAMAVLNNAPTLGRVASLTGAPAQVASAAPAGPSLWQRLAEVPSRVFARAQTGVNEGILMVTPSDRQQMLSHFEALDYVIPVQGETAPERMEIPRLYMRSLPHDLADTDSSWDRKRDFIKVMLPLVLAGNEKILADRQRAQRLQQHISSGGNLYAVNRTWLVNLADRYGIEDFNPDSSDWSELFRRVDIVPPSLALAQAAKESGWGTSRFARQGNAVFGQWSWKPGSGLIPAARTEEADHEVRRFTQLSESVSAYLHNLNTHGYYDKFRSRRAEVHQQGKQAAGPDLARYLQRYSEDGKKYIADLREIIETNLLQHLDAARLRPAATDILSSS